MTESDPTGDAGVAHAAPASPSVHPGADVVPPEARRELDRIRRRWAQLPLDRLTAPSETVRELVVDAAARTAPDTQVPDLGAPVLVDQLAVVVWDAYAAGRGEGLAEALTEVRRALP